MSGLGHIERGLLELLDRAAYGVTPLQAANALWEEPTDSDKVSVRRALIRLVNKGLAKRGVASRYYALGKH
jgi:hypothetical protein